VAPLELIVLVRFRCRSALGSESRSLRSVFYSLGMPLTRYKSCVPRSEGGIAKDSKVVFGVSVFAGIEPSRRGAQSFFRLNTS
jgi:hypothetical protein